MSELMIFVLVGVVLAAAGFVAWRIAAGRAESVAATTPAPDSITSASPAQQLAALKAQGRYSGVMIETHCRASARLAGRKFPIDEAPQLPTMGCDAPACRCRYIGLLDQRKADRRVIPDRRQSLRMGEDRRSGEDRRKDANRWKGEYDL
jgi:hypothetical protein